MSTNKQMAETLRELLAAWDRTRAAWTAWFGSEAGFEDWFITQTVYRDAAGSLRESRG